MTSTGRGGKADGMRKPWQARSRLESTCAHCRAAFDSGTAPPAGAPKTWLRPQDGSTCRSARPSQYRAPRSAGGARLAALQESSTPSGRRSFDTRRAGLAAWLHRALPVGAWSVHRVRRVAPPAASANQTSRAMLAARCASLTGREPDVLERLLQGMTYDGIAADIGSSIDTVKTYRARAFRKPNIRFKNELFARLLPVGRRLLG